MIDVILPVLNEAESLPWVLGRIPSGMAALVVDNGSDDGSGRIAAGLGARVVTEERPGFGAACWAGLCSSTSDVVCFMDCDGSLDPRDLPLVAQPVAGGAADLVLGSRRLRPGSWPLHARFANRIVAHEVRRRTGAPVTDLGPMRAAGREQLLRLELVDRRFGWPLEMVLKAAAAGWRIREVPVPYAPRRAGRSKVTGTVAGTLRTIRDMGKLLS